MFGKSYIKHTSPVCVYTYVLCERDRETETEREKDLEL